MPFDEMIAATDKAELRAQVTNDRLRTAAGWALTLLPVGLVSGRVGTEVFLIPIGVLFLAHVGVTRDLSWLRLRWVQAISVLWLFMLARTAVSDASLYNLGEAAATVRYGAFAVAIATWLLPDPVWRKRLVVSAAISAGFLAIDALVQFARGTDLFGRPMIGERLTGTFTFPRVGIMLAWLAPPAALGLYEFGRRLPAVAVYTLALLATALSGERAAFLTFGIFTAVMAAVLFRSRRALMVAAGALVAVVMTLLVLFPTVFERQIRSTADGITNLDATHYGIIWQRSLKMAAERPLFGYGFSAYATTCPQPEFGPQRTTKHGWTACAVHPHNIYIEFLVGVGVTGLAMFLAFVVAAGAVLWRVRGLFGVAPVFTGLVVLLAIRLFPLNTSTEFFRTWSSVPFWLHVGWALALASTTAPNLSATEKPDT